MNKTRHYVMNKNVSPLANSNVTIWCQGKSDFLQGRLIIFFFFLDFYLVSIFLYYIAYYRFFVLIVIITFESFS